MVAVPTARAASLARTVENVYYPSTTGHIFASPTIEGSTKQLPFYGVVSISLGDAPITVRASGRTFQSHAIAFCSTDLEFPAAPTPFVAFIANPLHPNFRAFSRLNPPVLELDRTLFAQFLPSLNRALDSSLSSEEARDLFDGVHAAVQPHLPQVPRRDARAQVLIRELWANPQCSMTELAARLSLSYHRTSHYFVEAVGISARKYRLWQKLYRVGPLVLSGATLTEAALAAGFGDSAHFSTAFQKAHGRAPSEVYRSQRVKLHATQPVRDARSAYDPHASLEIAPRS